MKCLCTFFIFCLLLIPSISRASALAVIGEDTRVRITDHRALSTHNSIGLIRINFGDKSGGCTGTVIGPRHVVTAGHCLFDSKMASGVTFFPALRTDFKYGQFRFGTFKAIKIRIHAQYPKTLSPETDLGLITFDENLPVSALPFRVMRSTEEDIKIAGYPGDKPLGQLWEGSGKRLSRLFEKNSSAHNIDTFSGQSGSAVRIGNTIVGVHSGARAGIFSNYNVAHFFTNDTLALIQKWMKEDR